MTTHLQFNTFLNLPQSFRRTFLRTRLRTFTYW